MSYKLKIASTSINYGKILKAHGLGSDNRARIFLANEVARLSDPYVPMQSGQLKNTRVVAPDGKDIRYIQPYAQVQYRGMTASGGYFRYNGAPMRGREWDKRMMIDHGQDVVRSVAKFVGGKPK